MFLALIAVVDAGMYSGSTKSGMKRVGWSDQGNSRRIADGSNCWLGSWGRTVLLVNGSSPPVRQPS